MRLIGGAAMAAMLLLAGPAGAQAFNGAAKIARGDYRAAERELIAARAANPDDVDLLLNLAAVYATTGRPTLARALYGQAAAMPDEAVEVASGGTTTSRALASTGLARLPATIAAR